MRKAHIIMGTTGEYSDRKEWPAVVFSDKAKAETRLAELEAWLIANGLHTTCLNRNHGESHPRYRETMKACHWVEESAKWGNPFDPHMRCDYTGTDYYLISAPLED